MKIPKNAVCDMAESGLYAGLIPNPGAQIKSKCQIHVQYDHTKILSHYLPYFESKNMCDPTLTPLIMTSSTYDVVETPENLFGLLIYFPICNFMRIYQVTKELLAHHKLKSKN